MTAASNRFGLAFPLTIHATAESVRVLDRAGVTAAYVYISDEPERRQQTRRVSREQGIEIARVIARAPTESRS